MRKSAFARLLFSLVAVSGIGVWVACGGSDGQDVIANDAGNDATSTFDSSFNEPDTSQPVDSSVPDVKPVKIYDAGQIGLLDGSALGVDGGIRCVVDGELEEEPNDSKTVVQAQAATGKHTLRRTRCGVVRVDNDAGEEDWLTFKLADASTSFYLQYEGDVTVHVEADGQAPVDITTDPDGGVKMVKGYPYYVQVRSKDGKQQVWRVSLFEE